MGDQNKETVVATNPFSSDDEEHHDFNNMNDYDVKQFVETIAHPEISIKGKTIINKKNILFVYRTKINY